MTAKYRHILILLLLLSVSAGVKAQNDSLKVDSVLTRIRVILDEYNEKLLYVDTSEYVSDIVDADNFNLQTAASLGACNEILRLFATGADVNTFAGGVATPLHYAVASGKKEAVEILLLLGASPDKRDQYGNTPLIAAVRANDLDISELLIRYGASVRLSDNFNSAPLHHAAALGFFYITDMLLYYDSPVEIYDDEGNTPLMIGVSFGYYDISDILLQAGADPNTRDSEGFTPLMAAAQRGDTLMMRLLLNSGANLYAINDAGLDALGCAARFGQKEAVAFLLGNGKRWTYNNEGTKNPASIAKFYGHEKLVSLLGEHGISDKQKFALEEITFSPGGMFTSHYLLMTGAVSLTEPRLKAGITVGAAFNPFRYRLLVDDPEIIHQYRVNTSVISAGVFKDFIFHRFRNSRLSAVPALSAGYRFFSEYEGTNLKPENSFCIIPSAEIRWRIGNFAANAGFVYMKMPFYKVSPAWFSLGISYTFSRTAPVTAGKKIKIYNYEE